MICFYFSLAFGISQAFGFSYFWIRFAFDLLKASGFELTTHFSSSLLSSFLFSSLTCSFFSCAFAVLVFSATNVAEFVATSACHVVTSVVFENDELASGAPFCAGLFLPSRYCWVYFCHCILNLFFALFIFHFSYPSNVAHAFVSGGFTTFKA